MDHRGGPEPDDEIRHVIVRLAVVQVGNRETKAGILHEGFDDGLSRPCRLVFLAFCRLRSSSFGVWPSTGGF